MKGLNFILIGATAFTLASCGTKTEETVEKVTYKLDVKSSSLKWKGSKNAEYFHTGTVAFTEGSVELEGDNLVSGSFSIDMNSIVVADATLPDDKKAMLAGHLKDTAFFFVAENNAVTVAVNGYEKGKLSTIINVRGQEIAQEIPVTLTVNEKSVTIKGKFDLDLAALKMAGMEPDPTTGEKIQTIITYELDLTLNK